MAKDGEGRGLGVDACEQLSPSQHSISFIVFVVWIFEIYF